jgi:hypothetical protein
LFTKTLAFRVTATEEQAINELVYDRRERTPSALLRRLVLEAHQAQRGPVLAIVRPVSEETTEEFKQAA